MSQKTLLECKNLEVGYHPKISILKDLNIQISSGQLNCLMGPNGIGKSTLLRTLCGLQEPLAGTILIDDSTNAYQDSATRSKRISVVLTDKVSGGNLSVAEFLELGRYPYTNWLAQLALVDKDKIQQAVEVVGLGDLLSKKLHQLSDGQLQRAQIGRALVQDGEIMILDEPTAHLDVNNRVEVMKLLKEMAHQMNKAVLVSTHDLDLSVRLADNMLLISRDGRITQGIPEDLILTGKMDKTFELKGFNLKTGESSFYTNNGKAVCLLGRGYTFLWVKNALERNGYQVVDDEATSEAVINVISETEFQVDIPDSSTSLNVSSIGQILTELSRT